MDLETPQARKAESGRKIRVDDITSNTPELSNRCLIENTHVSNGIQYAHLLPISTLTKAPQMMDSLEYFWGLKRYTLNVDTRYNIIRLSPSFHRLFDADDWLLVPEKEIVDRFFDHSAASIVSGPTRMPRLKEKVFKYTFVASPDMSMIPIHRQHDPEPGFPEACDFVYYPYPYVGYVTILSHAHPRFVILNSASKLKTQTRRWAKGDKRLERMLQKMETTYSNWLTAVPASAPFLSVQPQGGDSDEYADNSIRTKSVRVLKRPRSSSSGKEEVIESRFDEASLLGRRLFTQLNVSDKDKRPLSDFSSCGTW